MSGQEWGISPCLLVSLEIGGGGWGLALHPSNFEVPIQAPGPQSLPRFLPRLSGDSGQGLRAGPANAQDAPAWTELCHPQIPNT